MKQVIIKGGTVVVDDAPAPAASPRGILVRVERSCVSVGTELASVQSSGEPLYRKALRQPEKVLRVLKQVREQGLKRTTSFVSGRLNAGHPSGYSVAGEVVAVGEEVEGFSVGDRVGCAGNTANHAEYVDTPVMLAVKLPDGVSYDDAATVTLGAIAMQGVRRANPTLGETVVVVGLGILGQITAQLLQANGCRVIGTDLDPRRIQLAVENGMHHGIDPSIDNTVDRVHKLTDGYGADAVIITAATRSDQVISDAAQACRRKGRVVLVGDVGLNLKRADFFRKEIDFFISTSYGPGRYDPVYEELGQDYPLPYVRWTETRNMAEYLRLLGDGKVTLANLGAVPFPIDEAPAAYAAMGAGNAPLLVLLAYPERAASDARVVRLTAPRATTGVTRVALVGAGNFAQGVHLPNLQTLEKDFAIQSVMSRTGATAKGIATQYRAEYATTDYQQVLGDERVDLVLISTRHNLHASMALEALRAGKSVFVEKPLALNEAELAGIERFYEGRADGPLLMTGFNRRFSPALQRAKAILAGRTTPLIVNYRMNAGFIPTDSWVHGPEGGGRNIGEACHIYDVFNFLTDARSTGVQAAAIDPRGAQWKRNDNFVATITYDDGSVCTLTYTSMGDRTHPKEQMEIFADGKVIVLDDFTSLRVVGSKAAGWASPTQNKGPLEELQALSAALRTGGAWPIPLWQQLQATRISFQVERQVVPGANVDG